MQYPLLKGVHFTYEFLAMKWCKASIQNEKGHRPRQIWEQTFETFYFTKCTLLNCACIEKKEGREGKTDKLLRTPYNHWSMHGLNQCNLQMLTAFTHINFSYTNSFIIFHNKKKLWKFSKKKDMINRTPSIVVQVNNILKYKESYIFIGTLKNLLPLFSCFLPHIFRKIFKILYKSMDDVLCWEF